MKDTINLAINGLERASEYLPTDEALALHDALADWIKVRAHHIEFPITTERLVSAKQLIEARAESEPREGEVKDV